MAKCMDCQTPLSNTNTTGICADCKRETATWVPSPKRIRAMCERIKKENMQRDLDVSPPRVHRVSPISSSEMED